MNSKISNDTKYFDKIINEMHKCTPVGKTAEIMNELVQLKNSKGNLFTESYDPYDLLRSLSETLFELAKNGDLIDESKVERLSGVIIESLGKELEDGVDLLEVIIALSLSTISLGDQYFYTERTVNSLISKNEIDKDFASFLLNDGKEILTDEQIAILEKCCEETKPEQKNELDLGLLKESYINQQVNALNIADILFKSGREDLLSEVLKFVTEEDFILISKALRKNTSKCESHEKKAAYEEDKEWKVTKEELKIRESVKDMSNDDIIKCILSCNLNPFWLEENIDKERMSSIKKTIVKKIFFQ